MTTVPAPLHDREMSLATIADLIDKAAELITKYDLQRGEYWQGSMTLPYAEGVPLDVIGAVAVAMGITDPDEVERLVDGSPFYNATRHATEQNNPHPAILELVARLGLADVPDLMIWSDSQSTHQAVTVLRAVAAAMRIEVQAG